MLKDADVSRDITHPAIVHSQPSRVEISLRPTFMMKRIPSNWHVIKNRTRSSEIFRKRSVSWNNWQDEGRNNLLPHWSLMDMFLLKLPSYFPDIPNDLRLPPLHVGLCFVQAIKLLMSKFWPSPIALKRNPQTEYSYYELFLGANWADCVYLLRNVRYLLTGAYNTVIHPPPRPLFPVFKYRYSYKNTGFSVLI
jgi:hypothetical protein